MTRRLAVTFLLAGLTASRALAQGPEEPFGIRVARLRADSLVLEVPAAFEGSGRLAWPRRPAAVLADEWMRRFSARLEARAARRWSAPLLGDSSLLVVPARADLAGVPALIAPALEPDRQPLSLIAEYAQLGMQVNSRLELRMERFRNERCTSADATRLSQGCRGGFNAPRLEPQFTVRAGGLVGQRLHVNVDYDSEREFQTSNNVNVYYQGLEDEILRRVEVGNVTFAPPASRFITAGIPSNNFGVRVEAQLGALELSGIFAQQQGNVVRGRTFTIGDRTVLPVERELQDRDFEPLRFFFVIDPALLPGYPAVDPLGLSAAALPASQQLVQVRAYRRRSTANRPQAEQALTGIEAVAVRDDSPQRAGPFTWEALIEGRDYYLDPSGLWLALVARLDPEDFLAVSYVTAAGDTVGTFPAVGTAGRVDTLVLIHEPRRGTEVPTFRHEMRNAYRVGATDDVVRESATLRITVAEAERPTGSDVTFLQLTGVALSSDGTRFDQYNRMFPRERDPGGGQPLRDMFVVFPHLTPFADTALAPEFRNDSLYRTPTYLLRTQGPTPLYSLRMGYDSRGGDDRRILSLGGFQIRAGSERITAGGRALTRGVDYTMNYEVGQVTFLNPDSLFPQPTTVIVQYEENPAFAIAPTSLYGLQARYDLGDHGAITATGLLQRERTLFTRPPLGFEPSSNAVGGVSAALVFEPTRLTRLLDALPLVAASAPSRINLDAELAVSRPSPNQLGVAYVETFESEGGLFLPLGEDLWEYGSRPSSGRGAAVAGIDPVLGFSDADAVLLTWQNLIPSADGNVFTLVPREIDPAIVTQGTGDQAETVMWMALHPDTVGGNLDPVSFRQRWLLPHTPGPRWRSITLPLNATGLDLSRVEFLEFWVLEDDNRRARNAGLTMVLDFGTVYEDAVDFLPTGFRVSGRDTTYSGRRRAGEGRLDTERDTLTNAFNALTSDVGILGDVADSIVNLDTGQRVDSLALCRSELSRALVVYSWGSPSPHCTRRNGRADTEDLNNDQRLDSLVTGQGENFFRYVFPVGDQRFFVREGGQIPGLGRWRLYRIPFRTDTIQVGLPNVRQIQALRLTIAVPQAAAESTLFFALARMKLVGAPWVKRSGTPIAGLSGSRGQGHGEVIASVVSTENRADLGYEPPPGVTDQGSQAGGGFNVGAVQINERSLRLIASDVRVGERAEAFYRFPEGERNFLGYRQLRVWARGRGAGWNERHLAFYVKVAQDENNFYLYRAHASTATWEPEAVVDIGTWLRLRAEVETRWLRGEGPSGAALCGGDSLAYVACSGPYLVHVRNPGVAPPNLARVQELAVGFVRDSGAATDSAELWVNDVRLTGVVDDAGYAGAVSLRVAASDIADLQLQLSRRDPNFRQLGDEPSYIGQNQLAVASAIRLERFGLERLGLAAPLSLRFERAGEDPFYLNRSDVLAEGLQGLRRPRTDASSVLLTLRRTRRGNAWWQRALVDNVTLSASWQSADATTTLSQSSTRLSDYRADYNLTLGNRSFTLLPGFVRDVLGALPGFMRRSQLVRGLMDSRLRWTPVQVQLVSGLTRGEVERSTYRVPVETEADTARLITTATAALRTSARIDTRPLQSLQLGAELSSERDLRDYGDTTTVAAVASQSRQRFLGADVGFERARTLSTRMSYAPDIASWLRPRFGYTSTFGLARDPNAATPERTEGDSAGAFRLPTAFSTARSTDLTLSADPSRLLRLLFGDSSAVRKLLDRLGQVDAGRRVDTRAQFNRAGSDPGVAFQTGLVGLGALLVHNGQLASAATEVTQDRISGSLRLPLNVQVTSAYAERRARAWNARQGVQLGQVATETDWPNVSIRWNYSPSRGAIRSVLSNISASAGTRLRESVSEVQAPGGGAPLRSATESRAVPLSLSVTWALRITTSVSLSGERARTERSGSLTLSDRDQLTATASFAFRFPQEYVPLRSDVRTSLRYSHSANTGCVARAGTPGCVPISDSRRTEYVLIMDTDMPPNVTAGLSISNVVTEDRHINRKFSQFVITGSVRIAISAGELR